MQEWMLSLVGSYGYLGIFALIFIENVFPPIPSEAVLLFGGALTVSTAMNVPGTVVAATFGSLAGAIVLYALGRVFQADRLRRLFAGRFGEVTHLKPEYVDLAESWFSRYEAKAVLICRCIPVVRSLISIPAGLSRMPLGRFTLFTGLGAGIWTAILAGIGWYLAHLTKDMGYPEMVHKGKDMIADHYIWIILFLAVVIAGYIAVHKFIMKPSAKPETK